MSSKGRKIAGYIHNPSKKKIRSITDLDLIAFHDRKYLDSILAHQYTIRRLALKHRSHYELICEFRSALSTVLDQTPLKNAPRLFIGSKISALECCVSFFEPARHRQGNLSSSKIESILSKKLKKLDDPLISNVSTLISDEIKNELSEIINRYSGPICDFYEDYNFTDYFTLFSLSNFVTGKNLANHYYSTKAGKHKLKAVFTEIGLDELQWRRTKEAVRDDELCGIVLLNCNTVKKLPSNVQIFGHSQHKIKINDKILANHLVLAVPLDQAPINIDHAVRLFREALRNSLIDVNGYYAKISNPEFDNSLFMTNHEDRTLLNEDIKNFRSRVHGLWGWDLVNNFNNLSGKKLTIMDMCDSLCVKEELLKKNLGIQESCYAYESNKNHYDKAVKLIGTEKTTSQTELDKHITRSRIILGRR